jgi:hypothetical protein
LEDLQDQGNLEENKTHRSGHVLSEYQELPLKGKLQLYADDAIIIYSSKKFQTLQHDMSHDLNLLYDWFYNNLLAFNVSKTKYMIFFPKNKIIPNPYPLMVKGCEVERVKNAKYLGLVLDEKLKFDEHIAYIKSKISPFLAMLRRTNRILPETTKLSVYYSYIHCHLLSLLPVWGHTANNRLEELERYQNKALRLIFWNEYNTNQTDTNGLYKKHKILRLRQLVRYESSMMIFKIKNGLLKSNIELIQYSDIHDYGTRNRSKFYLPDPRTNFVKKSIMFDGLANYNNLPIEIKNNNNLLKFKKMLKSHVLNS